MDPNQQLQQAHMLLATMIPMIIIFGLIYAAIIIVPFWVIFKKAGFSGALSLLLLIPVVNLVMLYVLAFSQWKVVP